MDSYKFVVSFVAVYFLLFVCREVEGVGWNLSAEDHLKLDRQLKVLNKPAIKTLRTNYGEIYDCVDFYKQPAFDHPLLKNHTINYQWKPSLARNNSRDRSHVKFRQKQCPFGTVPIRRITKEDLIRERLMAKVRPFANGNPAGVHNAVFRYGSTIRGAAFDGCGADGNVVYKPECSGQQYSAGRIKISFGDESLEAGWRVDPSLYGDNLSHFYIRTDAGQSHCFDTRCFGFIVTDPGIKIGAAVESSRRGGPTLENQIILARNKLGDWRLEVLKSRTFLGYWPSTLFTRLQKGAATLEWGGEVYSPPGTPKPPMGAGFIPDGTSYDYDAYFRNPFLLRRKEVVKVEDGLDKFEDSKDYQVRVRTDSLAPYFGLCLFYGGSGGSTTTQ